MPHVILGGALEFPFGSHQKSMYAVASDGISDTGSTAGSAIFYWKNQSTRHWCCPTPI